MRTRTPTPNTSSCTEELCNNLDDDCDDLTDGPFMDGGRSPLEDALYALDNGKYKGDSCGTGACLGGTVQCASDQTALECSSEVSAEPELCAAAACTSARPPTAASAGTRVPSGESMSEAISSG